MSRPNAAFSQPPERELEPLPADLFEGLREYPARVALVVRDLLPVLHEIGRAEKEGSMFAYGVASRKLSLIVRRLKRSEARAFDKAVRQRKA
jgi:hypothetical protein